MGLSNSGISRGGKAMGDAGWPNPKQRRTQNQVSFSREISDDFDTPSSRRRRKEEGWRRFQCERIHAGSLCGLVMPLTWLPAYELWMTLLALTKKLLPWQHPLPASSGLMDDAVRSETLGKMPSQGRIQDLSLLLCLRRQLSCLCQGELELPNWRADADLPPFFGEASLE